MAEDTQAIARGADRMEEFEGRTDLAKPVGFREQFSESVRAGAQQVKSDVKRFGAITNFIRGNEEEAQKQLNYANRLQESYSSIIEPIGNFEEFLDQPTFDGFVDEVSKVGLVVPQAFFSVASGGAGLLTGLLGKAAVSVGGRSAAKKLLKDLQTKKLNNKKGIGPALTPEENEILENVYQGLRAAKYSSAGQAEAGRQLAATRAANIPFAQLGFWGGAFAQGEVVGASQSFQEYEDAGYELTADEAKMALLLGLPQAALDTLGERVFFGALTKKLTGDLVSEPRVRKILDKRKAGEALSKADEQVLKAALGDMSAGLFLKDLGKAAASGFLLGGTQEGLVELGQEEILIRQRQTIDPDYGEEEANLRRAEAAFLGFFAGAGRTAPTNTIAKAINLLATGKEISGDIRTEAMALTSAAGADGAAVTGPVPETPRAIIKQIKNLLDGKNPRTVVFVPNTNLEQVVGVLRESGFSSEELDRIGQFSTNEGYLLFDSNNPLSRADAEKVHKEGLDSEETLRDVLGFTEVQSPLHTTVVTAKDADGDIVFRQTVSDTKEAVDAAVENAERRNPGATVSVQSKEDAIKESLADAEPTRPEPTRQGELDLGDPQQPPSAEPQVRDIDEVGDNQFLSIDQQEEFQQTEGQTLGDIAVETADGQQLEFGQLRDAFSIREEPEPIAPLAGPTGKTEFVGLSSLISDRRRQQETPTQEAKDKLFSELPSVRNILDNLPNSFVQALLKAIEQDPSIDINVNTTTRQALQDQFGPARSEVVYTADVTERGEKAEFNEKVREAKQSGNTIFNPKTNDSNVKGMFSIPKKKLDAGQGVKSQEEIVERGINIIPLLNYIIDREGISLTIPTPTRYTQALQILIPEMIENGTPLYYGFAGQRQGIVSYISSYIEDTQKGGEGNVYPVLIPQFQFENGRYVEKQKQVTDEDGITRNKADRIVLNVRELQKARRAPSPVGPDQQANKPETGGNPVRNLFLNILRSDPEGDIAKIYEDFAKKFNKAAEERNKAMPTTTPARITGRPKMSRKFRLLPEKLTPAEIRRIREDLSGVGRLDGATKAEFKRRRAGFAQPPLSPEEEALLAKQEIRDQLTPPIPLFATPIPAAANIVAVETSTEFGSFNREQPTSPTVVAAPKVISGGQTGADIIFVQAAKEAGLETGGLMPRGFVTEDGRKPEYAQEFNMEEDPDTGRGRNFFLSRTKKNVANSDGTIIVVNNPQNPSPGSRQTVNFARELNKPFLVVGPDATVESIQQFITENNIKTLNGAGSRGSKLKNQAKLKATLVESFKALKQGQPTVAAPTQEGPSNLAEEKLRAASVTERDVEFRREQLLDYARENDIEIFDQDTETFGQEQEAEGVSETDKMAESSVQTELAKNTNVYDHAASRINREQRRDADNKEFITQRKVTPKKERPDKNISATNEVNEYFRTGKGQGGRQLLPFFFNKVAKLFTTDRPIRIYSFKQRTSPTVVYKRGVAAVRQAEAAGQGINILRKAGNEHYGNPFTMLKTPTRADVKVDTLEEAVNRYTSWLEGTSDTDLQQTRRQWILDQIDNGALDNQNLLYFTETTPNHAEALAAFVASRAQISEVIADLGKASDETVIFEGQEITAAKLISNIANAAVQKRSLAKYIRIGDRDIIFINTAGQDTRSKVAALYGVAHELGHAVFLNEMDRSLKTPKYKMLMKAFEADKARVEAAGSQKYQGKFGFEEWFADQTAAWLIKTNAKNAVDSFFKRVYERLKSIFDSLNETFKGRFTLNATFEEFINDVAESNKQANQGAEKLSYVQEAEVRDVVEETTRGFKKHMSPKLLQYVKNQMAAILRYSAPKDSVGDHRKHVSLNYIFRSAEGYLRSLGPAGKEIARLFYSRSSSKDKFGYLNARVLVVNSYLNDLYSMKDRNGVPLFEDENGEPNIDKLRTITTEAESSTPTNNLSPEAKRVREFLTEFFNEYITDKDKDITPLENFFPRKWNIAEIIADPQKRKVVAELLEKYNDELPEGYNSWLDYVEDWVVTDEDNDTITYNSDEAELSIGMSRKRQEYFKKIPTEAARRGLNEAGEINPVGQDAEVLVPSDYAIRAYLEDMIKKLEYEQKVVVTPTEQDVENLRAIYPQKTNKAGNKIEDPRVLNILGTTDTSRKLKELKGWQAMEVLLARIKDDADRQGARKSVEAMLGKVGMDMSPIARKINSWALLGNMVTLLTFAAIASLPDLAGPVLRSRNMTGINTIVEQMSYLFKNKEAAERFARDIGVVTHDSIETMYINAAELGFMTDTTKKYARTFFRVTFLEQYTKFTRVFASLMGQQFLLRLAQDGDAKSLAALAELDVTKQQVLNWQKGGRKFNNADGQAVKTALGRFVEESIVRPNAAERPVWASNPYTALIWQLKSFFYAYGKNIVGGVKRSMQNNYKQDGNLPSAVYPMLLAGMFLLPLTAIGLELRELIKYLGRGVTPGGRTFEDTAASFRTNNMNWGEYIQELLDRSGIYGPLALLFPMMEAPKYGDSWFFPALGPTAERFEDVFIDGEFDSEDYVPFAGAF